jgi:hypothetical protein
MKTALTELIEKWDMKWVVIFKRTNYNLLFKRSEMLLERKTTNYRSCYSRS